MSKNLNQFANVLISKYANGIADDLELNQNNSLLNSSKKELKNNYRDPSFPNFHIIKFYV
jgi:hypothetical protein